MQIPANETERLQALQLYKILDTGAEKSFDDLTRLAAAICDTPISLVSLIDTNRQWFKSRFGLDETETPRELAFCAYAILSDEILVVEDAQQDPRFCNNALVTGEPRIRFYAGAPLTISENINLGTLCVIDTKPRKLTEKQLESLAALRDAVVTQLELKRNVADLEALEKVLTMCAWCQNVLIEDSEEPQWQTLHDYVAEHMPVSHGICPTCQKTLKS